MSRQARLLSRTTRSTRRRRAALVPLQLLEQFDQRRIDHRSEITVRDAMT